jgi:chemotaxis protein histidine kinase CheA
MDQQEIDQLEKKILEEFRGHAEDSLRRAEASLIEIGYNRDLADNHTKIFRCIHGLHGGALMAHLNEAAMIAGHLEKLIEKHNPEGPYDARFIDYQKQGIEAIRRVLSGKSTMFELIDPLD